MVFFNYSTMQMAAKVVYYGPGLCGKTTNLQWIFDHTSNDSRGEMVSLATETDRTLFFDLLPIDVGTIAGFNTRIQLYTVPGQVFYNTTRKLVLKGVDGVVFVADSQAPMLQANIDSLANLEENLGEMGLSLETIPVVLQFNKRDLPNVLSPEELNEALNRNDWAYTEASAINGDGVFETLKMVSKATLLALKKRLTKGRSEGARPGGAPGRPPLPKPPLKPPLPPRPGARTEAAAAPPESAAKPAQPSVPRPRPLPAPPPAAPLPKSPPRPEADAAPPEAAVPVEPTAFEAGASAPPSTLEDSPVAATPLEDAAAPGAALSTGVESSPPSATADAVAPRDEVAEVEAEIEFEPLPSDLEPVELEPAEPVAASTERAAPDVGEPPEPALSAEPTPLRPDPSAAAEPIAVQPEVEAPNEIPEPAPEPDLTAVPEEGSELFVLEPDPVAGADDAAVEVPTEPPAPVSDPTLEETLPDRGGTVARELDEFAVTPAPVAAREPVVPEPAAREPAAAPEPVAPTPVVVRPPAAPSSAEPALRAGPLGVRPQPADVPAAPPRPRKSRLGGIDALAELEKLRRQALQPTQKGASASATRNGQEIRRQVNFDLARTDLRRAHRFSLTLQIEDSESHVLDEVRQVHVDIEDASALDKLLLRFNIALNAKET